MANTKGGKKGRKLGRNKRRPCWHGRLFRADKNKRLRAERQVRVKIRRVRKNEKRAKERKPTRGTARANKRVGLQARYLAHLERMDTNAPQ